MLKDDAMAKSKKNGKDEVLKDYLMLEAMSRDIREHRENLKRISGRISKGMDSYNKYGLVDVLSMVSMHMERARKEIDKAKKGLKHI